MEAISFTFYLTFVIVLRSQMCFFVTPISSRWYRNCLRSYQYCLRPIITLVKTCPSTDNRFIFLLLVSLIGFRFFRLSDLKFFPFFMFKQTLFSFQYPPIPRFNWDTRQQIKKIHSLYSMCCSMRPPTPRLRINSEDFVEHEGAGPPRLENSNKSNSTLNDTASNTIILEAASICTTDVSVL